MKKAIMVLIFIFFTHKVDAADSLAYRANISANHYTFSILGSKNNARYFFPANSFNMYLSHGMYKTVKSDSNFIIQLGIVNTNYFQRTFYSLASRNRLNVMDAAMDNGIGIAKLRIKGIGNFNRETKLTFSAFIKTFYTNAASLDFKRFQRPYFGLEYGEALVFKIKKVEVGPFVSLSASYRNVGYNEFKNSTGAFTMLPRIGLIIKL